MTLSFNLMGFFFSTVCVAKQQAVQLMAAQNIEC